MKKVNLILFLLVLSTAFIYPQRDTQVKDASKMKIEISYVYTDDQKLVNRTDLECSYFIRKKMGVELKVTGAEEMGLGRTQFSDNDRLFINGGTEDGINDGDILQVIERGPKIYSKVSGKKLGYYYILKSQALVVCAYEDKSIVKLKHSCHPVFINDILVPYKKLPEITAKKPDFRMCRLPDSEIKGRVVYASVFTEDERWTSGMEEYITVDVGKDQVAHGDILLIYRYFRKDLPPLILGTGIVLWPEANNSTVKILDCIQPVEMGFNVVYLSKAGEGQSTGRRSGDEDIPLIKQATRKKTGDKTGEESLQLDILYNINTHELSENDKKELAKIGDFIKSKSQYVIILRGYSCSIGGMEHNLKLSQKRVEHIKKYLMDQFKIDVKMFETYHYGEKDPVYDNTVEAERRKNRRVNVQVLAR